MNPKACMILIVAALLPIFSACFELGPSSLSMLPHASPLQRQGGTASRCEQDSRLVAKPLLSMLLRGHGSQGCHDLLKARREKKLGGKVVMNAWWDQLTGGGNKEGDGGNKFSNKGSGEASQRAQAKRTLLELVSRAKRGVGRVSAADEVGIAEAMAILEGMNPTPRPAESPLLSGRYSLLYTGSPSSAERKKGEGVIGSAVTEITGASESAGPGPPPAVKQREVVQDIDLPAGKVSNRAVIDVLGTRLEVDIQGSCTPAEEGEVRDRRVCVAFRQALVTLGRLPTVTIPLGWTNGGKGPQGWIDTTYLDEDVRLGRGDKGSFFVTVRRPE